MSKILLSLLFCVSVFEASSQKVYFVYMQSENDQPFFVRLDDKIYSSSASGYLILSRLKDTIYNFRVGFAGSKWPEQLFLVNMGRKDHGYLLKNFQDKGWGLFDLQTMNVQMASSGNSAGAEPGQGDNKSKDESAFTNILAKVADDPSIKEKTVQPKMAEEKKIDPVVQEVVKKEEVNAKGKDTVAQKPVVKKDQPEVKKEEVKAAVKDPVVIKPVESSVPVTENKTVAKEVAKKETDQPKEIVKETAAVEYKRSVITKRAESSTTDGFGLIFIDDQLDGNKDTIRIVIPNPKPALAEKKETPKEEKKFLDITAEAPKVPQEKNVVSDTVVQKKTETAVATTKCAAVADEADFFKLRKTMAAAEGDDEMIGEARKYFKIKCFSTAQVKNLGALFLSDEGKYRFFDAAYNYVSDQTNVASLQSELKEEYYINRFKAMLRN